MLFEVDSYERSSQERKPFYINSLYKAPELIEVFGWNITDETVTF